MSKKRRRIGPALFLAALALSISACGDESSTVAASGVKQAAVQSHAQGPVPANLLQVCNHAQDAFRDGDLGDADQAWALSAELQGMIDVAKPGASRLLAPMIKAADAVAADGRDRARPALRQAEKDAFRALGRACTRMGSRAW